MTLLARDILRSALVTLCLLTLSASLPAQQTPPTAQEPTPAAVPEKSESAALAPAEKSSATAAPVPIEASRPAVTSDNAVQPSPIPEVPKSTTAVEKKAPVSSDAKEGSPFGDHCVPAGVVQSAEAVSLWGVTQVDGILNGKALSVFGKTLVNGRSDRAAVAVFGDLEINGLVRDKAVVLFGNLKLGEKAVVDGAVTVVFGALDRNPKAVVRGQLHQGLALENGSLRAALSSWVKDCLRLGRVLGFGAGLSWVWMIAGGFLAFYLLVALTFRSGVVLCAETFEQRPGNSLFAALLALILAPLLIVLLFITGIGALVTPFLIFGLLMAGLFGRIAMHAWLGRLITRRFGGGLLLPVAFSVLVGGVVLSLLSCVPLLGLCLHGLVGFLGLGVVIYTLILSMRKEVPEGPAVGPSPRAASSDVSKAGVKAIDFSEPQHGSPSATSVLGSLLIHSASSQAKAPKPELPHAGFCRRLCALGVDVLICGILASLFGMLLHAVPFLRIDSGIAYRGFPLLVAVYVAVMWKLRATTIGGAVFQVKIVRLDDAPLDWTSVMVRTLGCFLSLAVAGFGFFWIALDKKKQSWHDKIVGTVVICVPKNSTLV